MKKNIEKYISCAMQVLQEYENEIKISKPDAKINKELKGYLSSLGASILMSGLIPTLAVYAADENNSKANRWLILDWVQKVRQCETKKQNTEQQDVKNNVETRSETKEVLSAEKSSKQRKDNAQSLFKQTLALSEADCKTLEKEILDISIALKLSIRTFTLTK